MYQQWWYSYANYQQLLSTCSIRTALTFRCLHDFSSQKPQICRRHSNYQSGRCRLSVLFRLAHLGQWSSPVTTLGAGWEQWRLSFILTTHFWHTGLAACKIFSAISLLNLYGSVYFLSFMSIGKSGSSFTFNFFISLTLNSSSRFIELKHVEKGK